MDTDDWNPETDRHLPANYSVSSVEAGKSICKASLQQEMGLDVRPEPLLLGMVSRLTDQKGLDLIAAKAHEMLRADLQLVFLGSGDPHFEHLLTELMKQYPGRVATRIGFDERLAHRIEAGADGYLMPSRFEPCGLNQQYSLRYGTVPLVHAVGGLADSVVDANEVNIRNGTATGIHFTSYHPDAFLEAVWRMIGLYSHHRDDWKQIIKNGMTIDVSWRHSAETYAQIYARAIAKAGHN